MYSTNHNVEDTVLTIINDGNGSQCGMNYEQRKQAAECGLFDYRMACRTYSRFRHKHFKSAHLTREEIIEAAHIIQEYYREHVKEGA